MLWQKQNYYLMAVQLKKRNYYLMSETRQKRNYYLMAETKLLLSYDGSEAKTKILLPHGRNNCYNILGKYGIQI